MRSWTPRGDQIAFMRTPARTPTGGQPQDATVWAIRPDGTGLRQVVGQPYTETTAVFGWNGDGTLIGLFRGTEGSRYNVLDPATGSATTIGDRSMLFGPSADWREGSPAFVGAFTETPRGGSQYIVTADQQGRDAKTIVTTAPAANTYLGGARWRPGSDDLLYTRFTFDTTSRAVTTTAYITDASGRTPRAVTTSQDQGGFFEWSPDGRDIVHLSATGAGATLAQISADGTNRRVLHQLGALSGTHTERLSLA